MNSLRLLPLGTIALLTLNTLPASAAPSAAREWNEQTLSAIRLNVPNPPAHARNLFHTAVAMYNAWAAYDSTAVGYVTNEKTASPPPNLDAARREAVSYAAYRVLRSRFATGTGSTTTLARLDAKLAEMGYSVAIGRAAVTTNPSPAELGKRAGQAILNWGNADGFSNSAYPQPYNSLVNPNLLRPLSVLGTNGAFQPNMALGYGIPEGSDPNLWQPLDLSTSISQNGIPEPGGTQTFVGVQSLATTPFSLTRSDPVKPWIDLFGGPSRLSTNTSPSASDAAYKANAMDVLRASSKLNDPTLIDISPGAIGNNPLGTDSGTGFPLNPITGQPYTPNRVTRSDYVRVLAEHWADGPNSETPPGHWHVIANRVADDPAFSKRLHGTGPVLDDLEWDVKMYFSLSAATHDAACAAWALKRYYSGARPITMIRYMASLGQSSNPNLPSYHPQGLPLEPGVSELITEATTAPGGKHEEIWDVRFNTYLPGNFFTGQVAIFSWPGEHPDNAPAPAIATNLSSVRWMLGRDWLPFQRKTFNTPAFPGYISGHSSFSRAAAEALVLLTGSPYFPSGFGRYTIPADSMQIDLGPSTNVELQWCTYYDAADQAGQSRRWGGIHPAEDDFHGRHTGSLAGKSAFTLAEQYWSGTIAQGPITPQLTYSPGTVLLTWNCLRGAWYKIQASPDLASWSDLSSLTRTYDTMGTYTDTNPAPAKKYYRVVRSFPQSMP